MKRRTFSVLLSVFTIGTFANADGGSSGKRLRGVNRSGSEFACVQNNGFFDGETDDKSIDAMKSWNINVVRVPLNEDCWLDINGHNPDYVGEPYRNAITNFVSRLRSNDLQVILELHWSDGWYKGPSHSCYDWSAKCQKPMPDNTNAPSFWRSVAETYKNDTGVIFDLFNEPFPDRAISDYTQAWKCWRDGGNECWGFEYGVAGMQELLNVVRETGATNLVMIGGLSYANDLSKWVEYAPVDSAKNIAASWHSYNFNSCKDQSCWDSTIAPVAENYPLIVGEIGENDCGHSYIDQLMDWLDKKHIGYLGWTWNTWDCKTGPSLISDYNGTPTEFGKGLKQHFSHAQN